MKQNALLLLGYIFFWFFIDYVFQISANRTFTFVDDHTIISTYDSLTSHGMINYISEVLKNSMRFRPIMDINRLFYVSIFGVDIKLISYYFLLLAAISSFLLQRFVRLVGFSLQESLLFALLAFVGMQGVVWWRFDESENLGMFFMSIALCSGYSAIKLDKSWWVNITIFWISIVCMSLSKESFVIILPFFAILFSKKKLIAFFLVLICVIELLYIKFFIGTTFGYAGVDSSTYSLLNIGKVIAQYMVRGYGIPLVGVIATLSYQNRKNLRSFWLHNKLYVLIFLVGVLPFLLLYAKSGLNVGRYLLPLIVPQLYILFHLTAQLSSSKSRLVIIAVSSAFFAYHVVKFTQLQHEFTIENRFVQNFRAEIAKKTDPSDNILVLANPVEDFEKAGALMIYLGSENALNRKNAKLEPVDLGAYSNTHAVYEEFRNINKQAMNTDSVTDYKKWIVINMEVLKEIKSKEFLKTPHTITSEGSYSIIVFN